MTYAIKTTVEEKMNGLTGLLDTFLIMNLFIHSGAGQRLDRLGEELDDTARKEGQHYINNVHFIYLQLLCREIIEFSLNRGFQHLFG